MAGVASPLDSRGPSALARSGARPGARQGRAPEGVKAVRSRAKRHQARPSQPQGLDRPRGPQAPWRVERLSLRGASGRARLLAGIQKGLRLLEVADAVL